MTRPERVVAGTLGAVKKVLDQVERQQRMVPPGEPSTGISIPPVEAFLADRAHGFDPDPWLPRGRILTLPVLDAIDDVPLDLAVVAGDRPVVLMFYLGGWSQSCNEALRALEAARPGFDHAGAAVVAISPELPIHARDTVRRNGLSIVVAIDHCCRFARSLGLVFKLPIDLRRIARDSGVRLKLWNGEGSYDLPMPALILLDRERRIRSVRWAARTSDLDPAAARAALSRFAG